jgi:hypothetical protein
MPLAPPLTSFVPGLPKAALAGRYASSMWGHTACDWNASTLFLDILTLWQIPTLALTKLTKAWTLLPSSSQ